MQIVSLFVAFSGARKLLQPADHFQERVLARILCIRWVSREPKGSAVQTSGIGQDQLGQ